MTGSFRAALMALAVILCPAPALAADVTVFAAASLGETLTILARNYQQATGKSVAVSLAASSALARQIEASAGADIFFSADREWMDYLETRGLLTLGTRRDLLTNRLVLVAAKDWVGAIAIAPGFNLGAALKGGRLALADPDSVPAGRYGKAALIHLRAWDGVAGRLAPAENVRVALAYVARGEAPLGIVYDTDARAEPRVRVAGIFPASAHPPIVYPAALTRGAAPAARPFLDWLSSASARAVVVRGGFTVLAR